LCLIFVPADFKLHCKGTLEPVERRDVFARSDGIVEDVFVKHDDAVAPDQPLARLRNTELGVAIKKTEGERDATLAQLNAVQRMISEDKRLSAEERSRLHGQRTELQERLRSLRLQLELYETKQQDLEVTSPIEGKVVTWDIYNRLIHRPVKQGQVLMRIADPESSKGWQLELKMPEDRMGYLVQWQNRTGEPLQVEYILATDPGKEHAGTIKEIHYSAEVHGEEGNTVLIKVAIDRKDLRDEHVRPGATVSAKVYCGRRAVGFVWFHDLVAFFQSRVLFRFF
jgi:multidrug efflux pump subunit AcrA (membrane-fusion protein)